MANLLVIDDEQRQREIIKTILEDEGYDVQTADSAEKGLNFIKNSDVDVVLTDLKMSGKSGVELLEEVLAYNNMLPVVIMTAYGTIDSAVDAMRKGAFDYLTKPLERDIIVLTVRRAVERSRLFKENVRLKDELAERFKMDGIVGTSEKMRDVINTMKKVAPTSVTVLVYGESGTGKELIARAVHYNSQRATGPFTAINCAAIPENLIESELFGYEQGAFTGASSKKAGIFESTNGGTLFLDEVGELPLLTQSKMLRVLQNKEIRRIGGKDHIKADVRIIAATNKNLEKEVQEGRFREDLYYRLKVVTVELPPLRHRRDDINHLVMYFMSKYNAEFGRMVKRVSDGAFRSLKDYHWPGNIRQLESVIEKAILMADTDVITEDDIRSELRLPVARGIYDIEIPDEGIDFEKLEAAIIKKAMVKANNVTARAAKLLGMTYKTLSYRLDKFGLTNSNKNDRQFD